MRGYMPFSEREKQFIREHVGMPEWSYSRISQELGRLFPDDNGGYRSRGVVYQFATSDPDQPVRIQVSIPGSVIRKLKTSEKNIQEMVRIYLTDQARDQEGNAVQVESRIVRTISQGGPGGIVISDEKPKGKPGRKVKPV